MLWFVYFFIRALVACICLALPLLVARDSLWLYMLFWPLAVAIFMLGLLDPRYLLRRAFVTISSSAIAGFAISKSPQLSKDAIADDTLREVLNLVIAMSTGSMTEGNGWPFIVLVVSTLLILGGLEWLRVQSERPKDTKIVVRPIALPALIPIEKTDLDLSLGITITNTGSNACTINPQDIQVRVCWLWSVAIISSYDDGKAVVPARTPKTLQPANTCTLLLTGRLHSRSLNWISRRLRWLDRLILWGDVDVIGTVFGVRFIVTPQQ